MTLLDSAQSRPTDRLNEVYRALKHPARRQLLVALEADTPRTFEEIATLPAIETHHQKPLVALHHCHLPVLADAEFIEWTSETDTLDRGPRFDELRPHLDVLRDHW